MALNKNKEKVNKNLTFSNKQLDLLKKEINEAGGFDEFLVSKKAMKKQGDHLFVIMYDDTDLDFYWEKYVKYTDYDKQEHEVMRATSPMPAYFWQKMRGALRDRQARIDYAKEKQMEDYEEMAEKQ